MISANVLDKSFYIVKCNGVIPETHEGEGLKHVSSPHRPCYKRANIQFLNVVRNPYSLCTYLCKEYAQIVTTDCNK